MKGIRNIIRNASNKFWVEQLIDQALEQEEQLPRITDRFSPSWAGTCPRMIQLNMFGMVRSNIDSKTQRIFDNGNFVHERFVSYFKKVDKLKDTEGKLAFEYKGITVSGRLDIVVEDFNNVLHVGEMKSINDRGFNDLLLTNAPKDEHFLQWNIYSYAKKMPDGFILYENKNDQRIQIFPVSFDEDRFVKVMNKFLFINDCNRAGKLCPRPEPCPDGHWCSMKDFCKNENNEKEFNDTVITVMKDKLGGEKK
jgi:hypothetical protein